MNYIFYQTKTKYTNTGDALINHALIQELRNYGQLIANTSKDVPEEFLQSLGIRKEERINYSSELSFIRSVIGCAIKGKKQKNKVYVFSGPGDMYGGGRKLVLRNFISGIIFPVFRLFGVTIVRIGRSVGPISKLMAISEWFRCLFVSHYYVRDSKSYDRCHSIGIRKVKRCPDLSWIYDPNHEIKENNSNVVMVNLRPSIFDDIDSSFVNVTIEQCLNVLELLNQHICNMKVCVAYQIAEDEQFSKKIYDTLKNLYDVEYVDHQMKIEELSEYYGKISYHISNRMHSLLVGYKYGSLPIALIDVQNHVKISATFHDSRLDDLMIDIRDSRYEKLVKNIVSNKSQLMKCLFDCEKQNQTAIKDVLDYVFK